MGNFDAWYDSFPKDENGHHEAFHSSGCNVETALLYLNKEDPCGSNKNLLLAITTCLQGSPLSVNQAGTIALAGECGAMKIILIMGSL